MLKNILLSIGLLAVIGGLYFAFNTTSTPRGQAAPSTNTQQTVALTANQNSVTVEGVYVCLPPLDSTPSKSKDCAFGLQSTDGVYYAVNYQKEAGYMDQFVEGQAVKVKGYITTRENLRPDRWAKFTMNGLLTIVERPTIK